MGSKSLGTSSQCGCEGETDKKKKKKLKLGTMAYACKRLRQEDYHEFQVIRSYIKKFKASLVYTENSRTAKATLKNPVKQTNKGQ